MRVLAKLREGWPFDTALSEALAGLPENDRRLAHEMAAGVLRRQSALDARLAPLVRRGLEQVAPGLRDVLRLGAFQLTALDRVPAHAAVDTSVTLAKEAGGKLIVPEKMTQQDIADRVGASRDMISRIFKDLTIGGYVTIENRQITINRKPPSRW